MEEELIKLGLNKNEARIYFAGLQYGTFSASDIAAKAKIKRSTAYLSLDNLVKLGLASEILDTRKKLYKVESPDKLEKLTKRMKRKAVEAELLLTTLLPILSELPKRSVEEPLVSLHEGMNGIKNVLLDISSSKRSWYAFGSGTQMLKKLAPKDIREIIEEGNTLRERAGNPKVYFLTDEGIKTIPHFRGSASSREVKILQKSIPADSALILSEDRLIILNYENLFALVIKSKEVTDIVKIMYNLIWQQK